MELHFIPGRGINAPTSTDTLRRIVVKRDGDTVTLTVSPALGRALERVSKLSNRRKSTLIRRAIEEYLEDLYDAIEAEKVLSKGGRYYTLEEVKRHLGLDD